MNIRPIIALRLARYYYIRGMALGTALAKAWKNSK